MITLVKTKLQQYTNDFDKYNYLREFLQLIILKILDEKGYFRNIAFVGGTALRVIYDLNRFSEDLYFCLVKKTHYDFEKMMQVIERELNHYNLSVTIKFKCNKNVACAFIRFHRLLIELGLSSLKDQNLLIKFEIDQNTPLGFDTKLTLINKDFLMAINHFDLPSLFASKLHAVLCRKYTKGRDYYDLIWYHSRQIIPNLKLLSNAIAQTEGRHLKLDFKKLSQLLLERIDVTDFNKIKSDVKPFLADSSELRFFEKSFFKELMGYSG